MVALVYPNNMWGRRYGNFLNFQQKHCMTSGLFFLPQQKVDMEKTDDMSVIAWLSWANQPDLTTPQPHVLRTEESRKRKRPGEVGFKRQTWKNFTHGTVESWWGPMTDSSYRKRDSKKKGDEITQKVLVLNSWPTTQLTGEFFGDLVLTLLVLLTNTRDNEPSWTVSMYSLHLKWNNYPPKLPNESEVLGGLQLVLVNDDVTQPGVWFNLVIFDDINGPYRNLTIPNTEHKHMVLSGWSKRWFPMSKWLVGGFKYFCIFTPIGEDFQFD